MSILWNDAAQGSEEWLSIRQGRITGSRFKDARDKLKNGGWGSKALGYAYDVARQRCGGVPPVTPTNQYMRVGSEQEPVARIGYEDKTGRLVEEVGFAYTPDGKFGVSVDGLIDDDGVWECKTMVSSKTLFDAMVSGDISEYVDQCNGAMWLLHRKWVDLTLWCPDLNLMHTVRIERDENAIQALVDDLVAFDRFVTQCEDRLRALMQAAGADAALPEPEPAQPTTTQHPEPPAAAPAAPTKTVRPDEVPEDLPF